MTHPTLTPASLADTLAALARIKAVDAGAPDVEDRMKTCLMHDGYCHGFISDTPEQRKQIALAHLLDVCMGVMDHVTFEHSLHIELANSYGTCWKWRVENTRVTLADGEEPTHLSAACAVVRAIADVVGEKEGPTDE